VRYDVVDCVAIHAGVAGVETGHSSFLDGLNYSLGVVGTMVVGWYKLNIDMVLGEVGN
jgi:hypothetical protein